MTSVALALVQEAVRVGAKIRLEGQMLRLSAPKPLPDNLRAQLRQHKSEIVALLAAGEPACGAAPVLTADAQVDQDLQAEVADGVRAILTAEGAQGVPPNRWRQIQRDTRQLVERRWLHQALDHGWSAADLFGCDQRAPWHRLDRSGLVLLMGGYEIVELSSDVATLRSRTGSVLRHRRRPLPEPPVALLWAILPRGPIRQAGRRLGPPIHPIRGPTAYPSEGTDGGDVLGRTPPPS
jgi:TubC N-terminal docking domain